MKTIQIVKLLNCYIAKLIKNNTTIKQYNNHNGFTIVELLMFMGLLSIMLVILTGIFVSALDVQLESEANSSVQQDGNYILAKLSGDMHKATNISIPSSLGGSATNFQVVVGGVSYTYNVNSDNLELNDGVSADALNSYNSSISNFSATRLGNSGKVEDTLKINFTLTSKTKKNTGFETKDFETTLSLRRQ
ncbi:MAG: prepilin-type N-terminal cleavage/methylation domain-containing protein [Candidatus Levybacteria bacterium]|nr:prepilin-type N-terminal cleavage/methylation domain-containing protein [Candidatus Levybacteria bacterium]